MGEGGGAKKSSNIHINENTNCVILSVFGLLSYKVFPFKGEKNPVPIPGMYCTVPGGGAIIS